MARTQYFGDNWKALAEQLSTFTKGADGNRKADWFKAVAKWARVDSEPDRLVLDVKKHVANCFRREEPMNLLEGYVLCLIDEITGVVDTASTSLYVLLPKIDKPIGILEDESAVEHLGCAVDAERRLYSEKTNAGHDIRAGSANLKRTSRAKAALASR